MENKKTIKIMACVIFLLVASIVYSFGISPAIDKYITTKQIEAQYSIINVLVSQIQQNGYVQIPIGEEVLTLVPYQPETPSK